MMSISDYLVFSNKRHKGYMLHYLPQESNGEWSIIDHFAQVISFGADEYALFTKSEWDSCVREEVELYVCDPEVIHDRASGGSCLL